MCQNQLRNTTRIYFTAVDPAPWHYLDNVYNLSSQKEQVTVHEDMRGHGNVTKMQQTRDKQVSAVPHLSDRMHGAFSLRAWTDSAETFGCAEEQKPAALSVVTTTHFWLGSRSWPGINKPGVLFSLDHIYRRRVFEAALIHCRPGLFDLLNSFRLRLL